jgi:serine protein kinase
MNLNEFLGDVAPVQSDACIPMMEYLTSWASDSGLSANTAGRLLQAIGKPTIVDTSKDPILGRIFDNRTIQAYSRFADLFGVEEAIQTLVEFIRQASVGLEAEKQVIYLFGPTGSGKSTVIERLKHMMEEVAVWVLAVKNEDGTVTPSPVFENPLGLFDAVRHGAKLQERFKIPIRRLRAPHSRWAADQLARFEGDISKFFVLRVMPSMVTRTCIARIEPGDEMPDVGAVIGYAAESGKHEDYIYSGAFNRTGQGLVEFFEMFKAHPRLLLPLLGATQEWKYAGTGDVGEIPFTGIILAHSNEAEWTTFKGRAENKPFLERITPLQFPYSLRLTEEMKIYRKYMAESEFTGPVAPDALEVAARLAIFSRIADTSIARLRTYDGLPPLEKKDGEKPKTFNELRSEKDWREGMGDGVSPRAMFKVLADAAGDDLDENGIDPVSVFLKLERLMPQQKWTTFGSKGAGSILTQDVLPFIKERITRTIQEVSFEDYERHARTEFDKYVAYATAWSYDELYKDPDTDDVKDREAQNKELNKWETGASITNIKKFRDDLVKFVMRYKGDAASQDTPVWFAIPEETRLMIEHNMLPKKADLEPLITFGLHRDAKEQEKHDGFVRRLCARGFTSRQARRVVDWYLKNCS